MLKKCLSVLLAVLMLIAMLPTVLPAASFAANAAEGTWYSEDYVSEQGELVTTGSGAWTLDEEGTLTVSGSGELAHHQDQYGSFPWISYTYIDQIKNVVIEPGITAIGDGVFGDDYYAGHSYQYQHLKSITVPASVTSIAEDAFDSERTTQYDGKTVIYCYKESYAHTFAQEENLLYVLLDGPAEDNTVEGYAGRLTWTLNKQTGVLTVSGSGIMPPFVTSKPAWAEYYPFITSVVIGEGITSVGQSAFSQTNDGYNLMFENVSNIKTVQLPSTLQTIEEYAFYGVDTLWEINVPYGVTSIGGSAFAECSHLNSITLPDSVTSLGSEAFSGTGLKSVTLSNSLKSIPYLCFGSCDGLTSVTIPKGVASIEGRAFAHCRNLAEVTLPEGVTSIGSYAFTYCSALTGVSFPQSVRRIGSYAFQGCNQLTYISFAENNSCNIGRSAFSDCRSLADIGFSETGSYDIGEEAFMHCDALAEVTLPGGVQNVHDRAFAFCGSLNKIYMLNPKMKLSYSTDYIEYGEGELIQNMITPVNTVVYGYTGSTAETYADTFNLMFIPITCAEGHEHSFVPTAFPKCGTTGIVAYTCEFCGNSYQTVEMSPHSSHSYVFHANDPDPESGDEGEGEYICEYCGDVLTDEPKTIYDVYLDDGTEHYVTIPANDTIYLRFQPQSDDTYTLRFSSASSFYVELLDADYQTLDSTESNDISISYEMYAGRTYYYSVKLLYVDWDETIWPRITNSAGYHEHTYDYRTEREYTDECNYDEYSVCYCSECGQEHWRDYIGSGSEHAYTYEVIQQSGCYEDGLIRYTCSRCGHSYDEYVPASHSYQEYDHAPSCVMMGYTRLVCDACGDEQLVNFTNATGHRDVDNNGICDVCGADLGELPSHTEHTFGEWRTLISASCAGKGAQIRSCACGAFETRETAALGHADEDQNGICDVCGCVISLPAPEAHSEHSFGAWKTVSAAACAAPGYEIRICACGEFETRQTEALGHLDADQNGVCDVCKAVIAQPGAAPHTSHTYGEWTRISNPSCVTAGTEIRVCSGCSAFEVREIAAAGHLDNNEDGICDRCKTALTVSGNSGSGNGQADSGRQKSSFFRRISDFFKRIVEFFRNLFRIS